MESQYMASNNGGLEGANGGRGKEVGVANKRKVRGSDLILRFLGFALTLVAAIVLGIDKQTKLVTMTVVSTLPPISVPVTAKWHYLSAFVYLVVANAITCAYAAISLLLVLANRGGKKGLALMIIILDLLMVALLFSASGAALAVGLIGYQGNSHVQWNKVCNVFGKFCNQVAAAIVVSLLGSTVFLLLVLLAALNLHKKH
ncbi:hypothetical protein ACH5RR_031163 [Cinchona calisaya]|uniref:CASP-like protein n=1 Tax=Cinchona calisaya TaxID=153742 RepID=A0ABD2YGE2_9GENT